MPSHLAESAEGSLRLAHTPGLPLGPFYPVLRDTPIGAPLWSAVEWPVTRRRMVLQGLVLDVRGVPLQGAVVEIWHADPGGRYRHADQPGADDVAAAFAGYGAQATDSSGAWRFASSMPGCYGPEASPRAPHVHFQVTHGASRLVTQMFFPDHAMNASDRWYRAVARPEQLLGCLTDNGTHGVTITWDIVMQGPCNCQPIQLKFVESPL